MIGKKVAVDDVLNKAVERLAHGQVDEFLTQYWRGLKLEADLTRRRDQNMGRNISEAEQRIRKRYPRLANKEPLILTGSVGSLHSPEKYTDVPIEVCDLLGEPATIPDKLDIGRKEGGSFEEMRPLLLAYGALELSVRGVLRLAESQIESMSFEELSRILGRV